MRASLLAFGMSLGVLARSSPSDACTCGAGEPQFDHPNVALPSDARGLLFRVPGSRWAVRAGDASVHWAPVPPARAFFVERVLGPKAAVRLPHDLVPVAEPAIWGRGGVEAVGLLILARVPLLPGGRYRFGTTGDDGGVESSVEIDVAREAMVAESAQLRIGEERRGALTIAAGGSCSADVEAAQREIEVELPERARRFAPALMFMTLVDGKPWRPAESFCQPTAPGRSWRGDGKELLFAVCGGIHASQGLAPDVEHTVRMRVHAPGGDVTIETPPAKFTLECPPVASPLETTPARDAGEPTGRGCGGCFVGASHGNASWLVVLAAVPLMRRPATLARVGARPAKRHGSRANAR